MSNIVFTYFLFRISMLFLMAFLLLFLNLRRSKLYIVLLVIACLACTDVFDHLRCLINPDHPDIIYTLPEIIIIQSAAMLLSRNRDFRALFTGISASTYVLAGNVISAYIYQLSSRPILALAAQVLIHGAILLLLILRLRKNYLLIMEAPHKSWGLLCLIPALFYGAVYAIAYWPVSLYHTPEAILGALLTLALMVCSYILLTSLAVRLQHESELQNNCDFLESYAAGLRWEADIRQAAEKQRALERHDMRHMVTLMYAYVENREYQKLRELLQQFRVEPDIAEPMVFCQNRTVNAILLSASRQAQQHQVTFICKATVPPELSSNEFELAVVVANLTENAVQAASRVPDVDKRQVKVNIRQLKTQLIMEISNSYSGEIRFSSETGLPLSDKGGNHGYGLRSVQSFAQKNNALFSYEAENNVFFVRMLLDY